MAGPSRIAAALDYLERLKAQADQAGTQTQLQAAKVARDFAGGVGQSLANRARDLGQMGYEAFTSAPSTPQTTAEFAELASQRQPTPMLDATAQGLGQFGKALVTDPVGTGRAMVSGELERARTASTSPAAAGEYAGSFIDPMRIAKALRAAPSVRELIVHHGTPHTFEPTEANPLGEFDASKIGTGEGAQAYGHGVYLAESPDVADEYRIRLSYDPDKMRIGGRQINEVYDSINKTAGRMPAAKASAEYEKLELLERLMMNHSVDDVSKNAAEMSPATAKWFEKQVKPNFQTYGSLYKADLPDEMIDRMIDYDVPFNQQPESVKTALLTMFPSTIQKTIDYYGTDALPMSQLFHHLGNDAVLAKNLRKNGIPGIKYYDQGSRQGEKQTRNFVVFPGEEKKVKILERK